MKFAGTASNLRNVFKIFSKFPENYSPNSWENTNKCQIYQSFFTICLLLTFLCTFLVFSQNHFQNFSISIQDFIKFLRSLSTLADSKKLISNFLSIFLYKIRINMFHVFALSYHSFGFLLPALLFFHRFASHEHEHVPSHEPVHCNAQSKYVCI